MKFFPNRQTNAKLLASFQLMVSVAEKQKSIIEESIARLLGRANNSRQLSIGDVMSRVNNSLEKYLFKNSSNTSNAEIIDFIDTLNADDLCLIIACENGLESAWDFLVSNFDQTVKHAARKVSGNSDDSDDLASSIWAELYGLKEQDGRAHGKLAYYSGRGSLAGWLRAVVSQLAVDQFRKQTKFVQIEEPTEFENLVNKSAKNIENAKLISQSENPEDLFSKNESRKDMARAFTEALQSLSAEDRLFLKLYYFDNLRLKEIGNVLGFHEATASRKLVKIQKELRAVAELKLVKQYGWTQIEVKKNLAATAEGLNLNLEKMLSLMILAAFLQDLLS